MLALLVVLIAGGLFIGYRITQSQYYIGESQGEVVIFRGLSQPVVGISLSSVAQRTGIPLADVTTTDLPKIKAASIAGGLASVQRSLATIRRDYATCQAADAAVRVWTADKPKQSIKQVKVNGKLKSELLPRYRSRPPIPSDCPPRPSTPS